MKTGSHKEYIGRSSIMQHTFLYRSVQLYCKIPRNITLIPTPSLFRKWLGRWYHGDIMNIPIRQDFTEDTNNEYWKQPIDVSNISQCEKISETSEIFSYN